MYPILDTLEWVNLACVGTFLCWSLPSKTGMLWIAKQHWWIVNSYASSYTTRSIYIHTHIYNYVWFTYVYIYMYIYIIYIYYIPYTYDGFKHHWLGLVGKIFQEMPFFFMVKSPGVSGEMFPDVPRLHQLHPRSLHCGWGTILLLQERRCGASNGEKCVSPWGQSKMRINEDPRIRNWLNDVACFRFGDLLCQFSLHTCIIMYIRASQIVWCVDFFHIDSLQMRKSFWQGRIALIDLPLCVHMCPKCKILKIAILGFGFCRNPRFFFPGKKNRT